MDTYKAAAPRFRTFLVALLLALLFAATAPVKAATADDLLPDQVGASTAKGRALPVASDTGQEYFCILSRAVRTYKSPSNDDFSVIVSATQSESCAFALMTNSAISKGASRTAALADLASGAFRTANGIAFCRGETFVMISGEVRITEENLVEFSKEFARTLDRGEGDVPVLLKHLPDWNKVQERAVYFVISLPLLEYIPGQPILNEISFEGGAEVVAANYGQSQLVIVEFTTPQFAGDNDRRIVAKIQELRSQGQAVPTAYRRVGNYSVFVFNAPDEKTANQLIDQVKYQQVVQWLGDDPHLFERLQRYYAETSANVLVAVLETSGLSLIFCLGIGALIGTLLFRHRRAQKATRYSDAGGTVRLNLDKLTGTRDSHGLLSSHSSSKSNPDQN